MQNDDSIERFRRGKGEPRRWLSGSVRGHHRSGGRGLSIDRMALSQARKRDTFAPLPDPPSGKRVMAAHPTELIWRKLFEATFITIYTLFTYLVVKMIVSVLLVSLLAWEVL